MSTNREVVSKVRSGLKKHSVDVDLTDRAIIAKVWGTRNKFVDQKLNKRKGWDSANVFTPLFVRMIEVPVAEFCNYRSDCTVSRSIHKLPKLAEGTFGAAAQGLFAANGMKKKFTEVSPSRYENLLRLGLPGGVVYYWQFNGYLWTSSPMIEAVIYPAVVEGAVPKEFSMDCAETESPCPANPLDQEFACLGSGMEDDIITAVCLFYKQIHNTSVADPVSNDKDESK